MSKYNTELEKLKNLSKQGLYNAPFYANRLTDSCFDNYEEFIKLPFMYKQELRETSATERTATRPEDIYGIFSSSGTTGDKTFYIYNHKDKKVHEEFVKTFYTELGIKSTDIGGVMAPVDTGVMAHTMMWQFTTMGAGYVNCPEPSPENMADVVTKVPVTVVATRPNVASNVIYNPDANKKARDSHVKKLLLGGGFLSSERRKIIEKAWDADCYNMFGMSEMFGPMAGECKYKHGQHYLNNYLMIEIVDPITKLPVEEGKEGVAVYTSLWEKGFPLLRYWTDDLMRISYEPCECGSINPRLFYYGRLGDCVKLEDRYIFPENVENILFKHGYIGEYKIGQKEDLITIKTESEGGKISQALLDEMNALFGCKVDILIVPPKSLNYFGHGKRVEEE